MRYRIDVDVELMDDAPMEARATMALLVQADQKAIGQFKEAALEDGVIIHSVSVLPVT